MNELSDFSHYEFHLLRVKWSNYDGLSVTVGGLYTSHEFYALFYWHGTYVDILECSRLWRRIKQWMN